MGREDSGEPPADGAPEPDPLDALPEDDPREAPDDEPLEPPGDGEAPEEAPSAEPPPSLRVLATLPPHDVTPATMRATTVRYNQCVGRRGIVMSLQGAGPDLPPPPLTMPQSPWSEILIQIRSG